MVIELTAQTVITAAGVVTALGVLIGVLVKVVRWVDKQKAQDEKISELESKHDSDMKLMREENQMQMEGILACLKGLQEQGCNGPVTKTAEKIEAYLNEKAHNK